MSSKDQVRNRHYKFESKPWAPNGVVSWPMRGLPLNERVRDIVFKVVLSGTLDAGDLIDATAFAAVISSMSFGRYLLPTSGLALSYQNHKLDGQEIPSTGDIAAGDTTWTAQFHLKMPFSDQRMESPDESAQLTEMLQPEEFRMTFAAATILNTVMGETAILITSGQVYPTAHCLNDEQAREMGLCKVPDVRQIGLITGTQDINLETGQYHDLLVHEDNSFGLVTVAEIATASLHVEGSTVHDQTPAATLRADFNQIFARGRDEMLDLAATGSYWVPVVGPAFERNSRRLHSPTVVKSTGGRLRFTGSDTSPQLTYWKTMPKTSGDVEEISTRIGLNPSEVQFVSDIKGGAATGLQQGLVSGKLVKNARGTVGGVVGSPRPYDRK